jgi:hypothetical protein
VKRRRGKKMRRIMEEKRRREWHFWVWRFIILLLPYLTAGRLCLALIGLGILFVFGRRR